MPSHCRAGLQCLQCRCSLSVKGVAMEGRSSDLIWCWEQKLIVCCFALCLDLQLPVGVGSGQQNNIQSGWGRWGRNLIVILSPQQEEKNSFLEIIKSFSSSGHHRACCCFSWQFSTTIAASLPGRWLAETEVRWESSGLSWEAKPRVASLLGPRALETPAWPGDWRDAREQDRPGWAEILRSNDYKPTEHFTQ